MTRERTVTDFLDKHSILARVALIWAMSIVSLIVLVWLSNFGSATAADASIAGQVIALFGVVVALLQWSRGRSK